MRKTIFTYVALLLFIALIGTACAPQNITQQIEQTIPQLQAKGDVIVGITDKQTGLQQIDSIYLTITEVAVHKPSTGIWIPVFTGEKAVDLLALHKENGTALLAQTQLDEGTYNQIRLEIKKAVVYKVGQEAAYDAKLPSDVLKFVGTLEVKPNETATILFDFDADKSLHQTGNGLFILAPVIKLQTRSAAEADVQDGNVLIKGGQLKTDAIVGMNEKGEVGVGLAIASDAELEIDLDGNIVKKEKIDGKVSTQ